MATLGLTKADPWAFSKSTLFALFSGPNHSPGVECVTFFFFLGGGGGGRDFINSWKRRHCRREL